MQNIAIEIAPLRLIMLLILTETTTEFKESALVPCVLSLVKFTFNTIDMGTKYCKKQAIFSKIGC